MKEIRTYFTPFKSLRRESLIVFLRAVLIVFIFENDLSQVTDVIGIVSALCTSKITFGKAEAHINCVFICLKSTHDFHTINYIS